MAVCHAAHRLCAGILQGASRECEVPGTTTSGALMRAFALGAKGCMFFLVTVSHVRLQSCCFPTSHQFLPTLVSLFSINSSQSLCNPHNKQGERANKTLFFLTLIPTDPTRLRYLSLSQAIAAERILRSQELAFQCIPEQGDVMPTGNQIHSRFHRDKPSSYNVRCL